MAQRRPPLIPVAQDMNEFSPEQGNRNTQGEKRAKTPWTAQRLRKKGRASSTSPKENSIPEGGAPKRGGFGDELEDLRLTFQHLSTGTAMDLDMLGGPELAVSPTLHRRSQGTSKATRPHKLAFSETWASVPPEAGRLAESTDALPPAGPRPAPVAEQQKATAVHLSMSEQQWMVGRRILRRASAAGPERKRKSSTAGDSELGPVLSDPVDDNNPRKLITPPKLERNLRRSSEMDAVSLGSFVEPPLPPSTSPSGTAPPLLRTASGPALLDDPSCHTPAPLPLSSSLRNTSRAALDRDPAAAYAEPTPLPKPPLADAGTWRHYPVGQRAAEDFPQTQPRGFSFSREGPAAAPATAVPRGRSDTGLGSLSRFGQGQGQGQGPAPPTGGLQLGMGLATGLAGFSLSERLTATPQPSGRGAGAALLSGLQRPTMSDAMDDDPPSSARRVPRDASPGEGGIRCRLELCLAEAAKDPGPPRRSSGMAQAGLQPKILGFATLGGGHMGGTSRGRGTPVKLAWDHPRAAPGPTDLFAIRDPAARPSGPDPIPDLDYYNERLRAAALRADVDQAEASWCEMERQFVSPDQTSLNNLLRCYARAQQRQAEVFESDAVRDMALDICRRCTVRPNQLTINLLLTFYVSEIQRSDLGPDNLERIIRDLFEAFRDVGLESSSIKSALEAAQQLWLARV